MNKLKPQTYTTGLIMAIITMLLTTNTGEAATYHTVDTASTLTIITDTVNQTAELTFHTKDRSHEREVNQVWEQLDKRDARGINKTTTEEVRYMGTESIEIQSLIAGPLLSVTTEPPRIHIRPTELVLIFGTKESYHAFHEALKTSAQWTKGKL